jgi:ATPase subunit of ABC transporter with duplicated ATPase domains
MDIHELRTHIDARLDRFDGQLARFEGKFDTFVEKQSARNEVDARDDSKRDQQIEHLQGFSKLVITILLAACGFLAVGFFEHFTK